MSPSTRVKHIVLQATHASTAQKDSRSRLHRPQLLVLPRALPSSIAVVMQEFVAKVGSECQKQAAQPTTSVSSRMSLIVSQPMASQARSISMTCLTALRQPYAYDSRLVHKAGKPQTPAECCRTACKPAREAYTRIRSMFRKLCTASGRMMRKVCTAPAKLVV